MERFAHLAGLTDEELRQSQDTAFEWIDETEDELDRRSEQIDRLQQSTGAHARKAAWATFRSVIEAALGVALTMVFPTAGLVITVTTAAVVAAEGCWGGYHAMKALPSHAAQQKRLHEGAVRHLQLTSGTGDANDPPAWLSEDTPDLRKRLRLFRRFSDAISRELLRRSRQA